MSAISVRGALAGVCAIALAFASAPSFAASPVTPTGQNGNAQTFNSDGTANTRLGAGSVVTATPVTNTTTACAASTVTTGGTAVTFVTGATKGGFIINGLTAAQQGIGAAENAYVDITGATPGSTEAAANGTTVAIGPNQAPAGSISWPASASITIKVNAATSGHKLTCVQW